MSTKVFPAAESEITVSTRPPCHQAPIRVLARPMNYVGKTNRGPRERNTEGGYPKDPEGGHMRKPHTSQDKDVEGRDEGEKLSRRPV